MLRLVEEYKEPNRSFLDDENQMVVDALYTEIAEYVFEQWINNNLIYLLQYPKHIAKLV